MKDNRWLEIDGDMLEDALKLQKANGLRVRRILIASVAAVLTVCTLMAVIIPNLSDAPINESSINESLAVDIGDIVSKYKGPVPEWNGGDGLKLIALSGEKDHSTGGAMSNGGNGTNKSIDITLSALPNVKLERFTAGKYIDMTGNGIGRYDWYQESTGIYRDIITGEFFSLSDEIRFALIGDGFGDLCNEYLLEMACIFGFCKFYEDDIKHEEVYFEMVRGAITYEEAISHFESVPKNFGFSDEQAEYILRYFKGEEINVGKKIFPNHSDEQNAFNSYALQVYHAILSRRCGNVKILEFGSHGSKCLFTREHHRPDGSGAFECDLGIYDRESKEVTLVTIEGAGNEVLASVDWFGMQYTVNDDYTVFAYIDTSDGALRLIDLTSGKHVAAHFMRDDDNSFDSLASNAESVFDASEELTLTLEEEVDSGEYSQVLIESDIGAIGRINFSPNGKYAYCRLRSKDDAWLFVDTESFESRSIDGKLIKFVAGGDAVIMQTEKGFLIYDVATETDITDHCGVAFTLEEHETHAFFEIEGRIVRKNLINGDEAVIASGYDAFITDKNSGCVYVFTKSDRTVRGYSATDGECKYSATVGDSFIADAPENAIFNLLLDQTEATLLISYYTPLSLEFDESKFLSMKGNNWDVGGDISSIPDYAYIYLRSIKYNGKYLDCYDADDVNGEVDNVNNLGNYLMLEDILRLCSDDMLIDLDELIEIGRLYAERIEQYIEIDSMNRVKVIPESLIEIFGYELNTGEHFLHNVYRPATVEFSVENGKGYMRKMVETNVKTLSDNADSEEINAFIDETVKALETDYRSYLIEGYYRMKYEIKLEIRDRIISEYNKRF